MAYLALLSQGYICSQAPTMLFDKNSTYPCYNNAIFYAIRFFIITIYNHLLRPL